MIGGVSKNITFRVDMDAGKAIRESKRLQGSIGGVGGALAGQRKATNQAGFAMLNFNRISQDSVYFLNSMQMGVMAVSNNIPIFIESMERLKGSAGGMRGALKLLAKQFFTMPNMLMLGVTAVTAWGIWASQAKKETKELKEEVDGLKGAFSSFLTVQDPIQGLKAQLDVNQLKALRDVAKGQLAGNITANPKKFTNDQTEAIRENFKALVDHGDALRDEAKYLNALIGYLDPLIEKYENLSKAIALSEKLGVSTGRRAGFTPFGEVDPRGRDIGTRVKGPLKYKDNDFVKPVIRIKEEMKQIQNYALLVGSNLTNAFMSGNNAAQALLNTLISIAAQLAVIGIIKTVASGGTLGFVDAIASVVTGSMSKTSMNKVVVNIDGKAVAEASSPYLSGNNARSRRLRN